MKHIALFLAVAICGTADAGPRARAERHARWSAYHANQAAYHADRSDVAAMQYQVRAQSRAVRVPAPAPVLMRVYP